MCGRYLFLSDHSRLKDNYIALLLSVILEDPIDYRFKRMPFGLNMSPDIFQTRIDQTFEGCRSVIGIADDIMVYGDSEASHDANMHGMISRCKETGLKLNPDKCFIKQDQIKFNVLFETPPIFSKIVANPLHFRYVNAAECHISTPGTM